MSATMSLLPLDRMDHRMRRVAHLLSVTELDPDLFRRAESAMFRKTQDYYDALASVGQIPGCGPAAADVAVVYQWLAGD